MGLLIANGVEALNVTLTGGEPVRYVRVGLEQGLTVLYGRNGAGKTTVLDGISSALTGVRRSSGNARLHVRFSEENLFYGADSLMLARIAAGASARAGDTRAFDPESKSESARDEWDEALRQLIQWSSEGPPELDDEPDNYFEVHEFVVGWLNRDLRTIASNVHGELTEDDRCDVLLIAAGSRDHPEWEAFVASYLPPEPSPISPSPEIVEWFRTTSGHPRLEDMVLLSGCGEEPVMMRLASLGRVSAAGPNRCLNPSDRIDVDSLTVKFLERSCGQHLIEIADQDSFEISQELESSIEMVSSTASALFLRFTKKSTPLVFCPHHPNRWPSSGLGEWRATDDVGVEVPVRRLGSAMQRWASLAIELTLRGERSIVVVDEPENALHPAAQTDLADGLTFADSGSLVAGRAEVDAVLVATHSPALLAVPNACLLHVSRDGDGHVRLDKVRGLDEVDRLVESLGVGRADVLMMTRTFLLVEGEHDEAVLGTLFADELAAKRARVVSMGGAKQVSGIANAEFLLTYSTAKVVIVLDRVGKHAVECWNDAVQAIDDGDQLAAERALHRLRNQPGGEAKWVSDAGLVALKAGHLDRFKLVGLEKWDIIDYLPVEQLVAGATSWKALRDEHRKAPNGMSFKPWLKRTRNATITTATIRQAVAQLDDLADLPQVLDSLD